MHQFLEKLYKKNDLTLEETKSLFELMIGGNLDPILLTSTLVSLRMKGESYVEIAGAASALLSKATPFPAPNYSFGDIVGTGGDHSNTINISTLSAFIAASLGVKIAKHGNRSISSKCGSFDFLEALEIPFNLRPDQLKKQMDDIGICFLFAPLFHSGMEHVMPIRKVLKTKTVFNILGPLINPSRPTFQTVGVYSPEFLWPIAKVLVELDLKQGFVIHGSGLDEIAPHGETMVIEIDHGELKEFILSPRDFGFEEFSLDKIKGGDKNENLDISLRILSGKGEEEQKKMLAMNVAPLLLMDKKASCLKEGASMAMDQLNTSGVLNFIERFKVNE